MTDRYELLPSDVEQAAIEAAERYARANREAFEQGQYPGWCQGLNDGTGCPHTPQHSYDNVRS